MSFAVAEESCTHCWDATLEKDTILLRIVFYLPWKEQMRRLAAKENRSKRNSQCELQGFEFLLPQESEITGTTAVWWHWLLSRCLPQITVQKGGTTRVLKQAPGSSSVFVGVVSFAPGNAGTQQLQENVNSKLWFLLCNICTACLCLPTPPSPLSSLSLTVITVLFFCAPLPSGYA